ncbi:MAG: glycosyltransferase family 39 protein [Cyclobacteriaceae bacterium]
MTWSKKHFYIFYAAIVAVYFLNFSGNAIWSTHEAYYADAVRSMHETGILTEFYFNGEHRFQKPPMTYWLMYAGSSVFGVSEFGLRLPIVILSLLSVFLVFKIGELLYGFKTGLFAMLIFSVSAQFAWLRNYASPEIPLTFFFTLGLYSYLRKEKRWKYLSFIAIGFAALTKGFPYIFLFFLIIIFERILKNGFRGIFKWIKSSYIIPGLVLTSLIGLSWPIWMSLKHGETFTSMFFSETIGRVVSHPNPMSLSDHLLFYPLSILWGFFPFSVILLAAVVHVFRHRNEVKEHGFILSWLMSFLLVFTASSGKLPVYLLQAYPALALLSASFLLKPMKKRYMGITVSGLVIPLFASVTGITALIILFELSGLFLLLLPLPFIFLFLKISINDKLAIINFGSMLVALTIMFTGVMSKVEHYRPWNELRQVIQKIDPKTKIYAPDTFFDNLPYYSEKKVTKGIPQGEDGVVLSKAAELRGKVLWKGLIHSGGPENHVFKFLRDCYKLSKGDSSKFDYYHLVQLEAL